MTVEELINMLKNFPSDTKLNIHDGFLSLILRNEDSKVILTDQDDIYTFEEFISYILNYSKELQENIDKLEKDNPNICLNEVWLEIDSFRIYAIETYEKFIGKYEAFDKDILKQEEK